MTFSQIIDLVITIGLLVSVIFAAILVTKLRRALSEVKNALDLVQGEISKLVREATFLVDDAGVDVSKFETLLDAANTVTSSMGQASKMAYTAVASPVVKARALRAGLDKLVTVFRSQPNQKGRR